MGHYRNHTRGPQRLTRIQQMGVAISQNGGVMPFTLILFKTGKHYLTLNNINTTRGGVVCVCWNYGTGRHFDSRQALFTSNVVGKTSIRFYLNYTTTAKTILLSYYFLNYATYLVVVHCKSSKFNFLRNNNKSKFKRNRYAAQLAEVFRIRPGPLIWREPGATRDRFVSHWQENEQCLFIIQVYC